ncbi:monocarboxylate transporter 14-like [Littorina saxatilis]|uniref:Major facilitator superfamily (MFS) profile domain-containing protein n=1 Tax=Littorina saxatilis TaxID=31220 RepID=A0AAN9BHV0_9CAEN
MADKTEKLKREEGEVTDMLQEEEEDGEYEVILPKPPDGGWGWVIVFASLLANIIVDGITYTFGIMLPKFQEAFNQPKRTIALAGSLQVGTYLCAGPIVSALTNRYGCKKVTMIGSVVATAGFVLSVFAPSADILILTYGIIAGFGFGMMYLPAIVIVGYYFEEKRALATGIAVCGSGIGVFIMAPLSDLLLHEFGYKGTLLIMAGIVFNGAICGALMRPLPAPGVQEQNISDKLDSNGTAPKASDVTAPLVNHTTGNDDNKPESKPKKGRKTPAIQVLDSQSPTDTTGQFAFSSVPNMVFSSTREPKAHMTGLPPRQRSNTLDPTDRLRLRHVGKQPVHLETPAKKAIAPIGLSYIGVSDAQLNRVRASTHTHVSRRDMLVSGSVLHIPDHIVSSPHIRSAFSIRSGRSHRSAISEAEERLCSCLPESARDTLLQMLDFTILKNKAYVFILIGNVFAMLGFYVPFVFMPEKAMALGIAENKAAFLLSIIGITNTVGRVFTGVLANLNKIDSLLINNIAMLVCGIATFVTPFCENYYLLCFIAAIFGLCVAAYISLSSILLCEMLGIEQLTNAFGFLTLARGVSSCAGSPLAGAIIDATKDVNLAFYVGGALIVAGSFFHFLLYTPCITGHKPKNTSYDLGSKA